MEYNDGIDKPNKMQDQIAAGMWTKYLEDCGVPLNV